MSISLNLRLLEAVNEIPTGASARLPVDGPNDVEAARRWLEATGNTLLAVHIDSIEVVRGRVEDPVAALSPEQRPGYRLWVYTNFNCNLACDYCCASSSPGADKRVFSIEDFALLMQEARDLGFQELYVTGGEPFLLVDLDERLKIGVNSFPTTVLTNAMVWKGERLRRLETLPRDGISLQISLDSASPQLHDRHRGNGSFARALGGIRLAMDLGFRVRVAATLGADAGDAELELLRLFDDLGLEDNQRVIRRIAKQGAANAGLSVSRASLIPEVCVTAEGVWWHPVAAIDPAMRVSESWSPLAKAFEGIVKEYRQHRLRGDALAATFPCA